MKVQAWVWAGWACFAMQAAMADDSVVQLPEMSVSQTTSSLVTGNPSPQAEVSAQQIENINVINTEDALKYVPSLNIRKRYIGDRNSIISARTSVGAIPSATSLVYADGLLLSNLLGNSYSYPPRWSMVGAEEIEHVDVLYGPFSALLPGNSIGATVLLTTRRPQRTEVYAKAQAFQENFALYATDASYGGYQTQASAGLKTGNWRVSLLANQLDAHGHPMTFANTTTVKTGAGVAATGYQLDTDTTGAPRYVYAATSIDHTLQDTAKIRAEYAFSADTRLALTLAQFSNDAYSASSSYLRDATGNPIYTSTNVAVGVNQYIQVKASDFGVTKSDSLNRMLGLSFASKLTDTWRLEAVATDYGTPSDIAKSPNNGVSSGAGGAGTITYGDHSGWRNFDIKGIWQIADTRHAVTTGYHVDQYDYSSLKYDASSWQSAASITTLNTRAVGSTRTDALFAQDVWKLAPRWELTTGVRQERWQAFGGAYYDKSNTALNGSFASREQNYTSPKAALTWKASPDWLLRASLARAYRMPTVTELYGTQTDNAGNKTLADGMLRPEKVLAGDLTAEGVVGDGSARVSLFLENKEDYIYQQKTSVAPIVTSYQNIGKTRVWGVETAYVGNDVWMPGLDVQASLTYTGSEVLEDAGHPEYAGRALAIPKWRATAFATYRFDAVWSMSGGIRYATAQPSLDPAVVNPNTYGGTSGYTVADARLNYRFRNYLTAAIGVDNIGNEKYYAYHSYPQQTWHAELRIAY